RAITHQNIGEGFNCPEALPKKEVSVEAHYRTINQEPEAQEPEPKKEET
ncbi:6260_t:CDS:2, partial [Entrophospora sp. SA101]